MPDGIQLTRKPAKTHPENYWLVTASCDRPRASNCTGLNPDRRFDHANSNSIFFAPGSSLVMRKLRICPARAASGFAAAPGALPFQRALSMEPRDDTSAWGLLLAAWAGLASAVIGQVANTPSPNSTRATPPEASVRRPVTKSPTLCSERYS